MNTKITSAATAQDTNAVWIRADDTTPEIGISGADGDAWDMTINTSDHAIFENATAYDFDAATDVDGAFTATTVGSDAGLTVGTTIVYTPNAASNAGTSVADDAAITVTHAIMRVVGADADAVLDTDPAINDGAYDGQEVTIQGTVDGNLVTIADNVNTQLDGNVSMSLGIYDTIRLQWDSNNSTWIEISRSDN